MQIAILDPAAGISGDMTLGALVSAGVEPSWLEGLPDRLGLSGIGIHVTSVTRCGVVAAKVDFTIPTQPHGRHLHELMALVEGAACTETVKRRALEAFRLLSEAEGQVHGVPAERVHLHEVGAVDAVLDIVGAFEGFEHLGVGAVYNLPVALGHGWVDAAHGQLPVPAPATTRLVEGLDVATGGPVDGEATTPTGAALLRVLSQGPPPTHFRVVRSGWGAGTRDPAGYPNVLRLVVAESAAEAGRVVMLATDVDDLAPEYVDPLREAVYAAGALDCQVWPTQGKKGRWAFRVEVVAPPSAAAAVEEALFRHSTTAGVRRWAGERSTLRRRGVTVEVGGGVEVRVKVLETPAGLRAKPEYDDVIAAARALGRAPLEIAQAVQRGVDASLTAAGDTLARS